MKEFIEYLVKQIVENSDSVVVTMNEDLGTDVYTIEAHPNDMGLLIGKGGKTIRSIREMVKAKAIKDRVRVSVTIKDDI